MTNSLDNVLTQIDITGPNFDITTLISNRPLEKRGTGDSEYRDSLTRSLKESSRRNLDTQDRRLPDPKSTRSNRSAERPFENQSSNTGLNRRDVAKTPNERTPLKSPPTREDRPDHTLVKPDGDSESREDVAFTDVGEIPSGEESDGLNDEHFFKIQATTGMPPAEFQPFTITTLLDDDGSTEIAGEDISNSQLDGRAHAQSVIENLIDQIAISLDQGQLQVSKTLTPPAGLFQAMKALDNHDDTSENLIEINLELPDEKTIGTDSQIASLIDSVEFEVTTSDASIETGDRLNSMDTRGRCRRRA